MRLAHCRTRAPITNLSDATAAAVAILLKPFSSELNWAEAPALDYCTESVQPTTTVHILHVNSFTIVIRIVVVIIIFKKKQSSNSAHPHMAGAAN